MLRLTANKMLSNRRPLQLSAAVSRSFSSGATTTTTNSNSNNNNNNNESTKATTSKNEQSSTSGEGGGEDSKGGRTSESEGGGNKQGVVDNPFHVPPPTWQQVLIAPFGSPVFVALFLALGPVMYFGWQAETRLDDENSRLREERLRRRRGGADETSGKEGDRK